MKSTFGAYNQFRPNFPQPGVGYSQRPTYGGPIQNSGPAQMFQTFGFLLQAMQQLSVGWQTFGGMGGYGFNPTQGVAPLPSYQSQPQYAGPVRSNPNPYSLLPAGQSSISVSTHYGFQPQMTYGGPITPNPNPYSLLPAGVSS